MQRTLLFVFGVVGVLCLATAGKAQEPASFEDRDAEMFGSMPSDGSVTPEMWFYMQEYRRYTSPKEAVRRKAELRSQQRQSRLAAQRWFGFSNLRPTANPLPQMGSYSPSWVGNSWNPYQWSGSGQAVVYHVTRRGN